MSTEFSGLKTGMDVNSTEKEFYANVMEGLFCNLRSIIFYPSLKLILDLSFLSMSESLIFIE